MFLVLLNFGAKIQGKFVFRHGLTRINTDFFQTRVEIINFVANMKEFVISEAKAETAVLVGLITKEQDEAKTKEYLDELQPELSL